MDPLTSFTTADLMFVSFSANYSFEPDSLGQPGSFNTPPSCIPKVSEGLGVIVTAAEFGYPAINLSFHLTGVAMGMENGSPLVTWDVHQQVNQYIPDLDITVDRIDGQLTIALEPIDPPKSDPDADCGGDCHPYTVKFQSTGHSNSLDIQASKKTPLGPATGKLHFKNIRCIGKAAENVTKLSVYIQESPKNECGIGAVEGSEITVLSKIAGLPKDLTPVFKWRIDGADVPPGGTKDGAKLRILVPEPASEITVSLTVTVADCSVSSRITIQPMSRQTASLREYICNVLRIIPWPFWPPDPWRERGPDLNFRVTEQAVLKIHRAADQLTKVTGEILRQFEHGEGLGTR